MCVKILMCMLLLLMRQLMCLWIEFRNLNSHTNKQFSLNVQWIDAVEKPVALSMHSFITYSNCAATFEIEHGYHLQSMLRAGLHNVNIVSWTALKWQCLDLSLMHNKKNVTFEIGIHPHHVNLAVSPFCVSFDSVSENSEMENDSKV